MAVIENLHTGNGSLTDYSFTFPYLDTTDIKVSLAGVATTQYSLLNATTIRFNSAPGSSVAIRIYRDTAFETPKATFYPGSAIRANDLNDNTLQNLYVNQESNDKVADAWLTGDPTVDSSESWYTSDDTKIGTTKAIENRVTAKITSALTDDVVAGSSIAIADNNPSAGKITVSVNAASGSATGSMSSAHYSKLEGIETNATADQTDAEIRTAVENATDSNVFTDADHSKLNAIEASATADQSDAEIKTAYENNSNTNAYTDAEKSKLSGIEASATADQTNAEIRTAVENATDSNVFTDADHSKLNSCESNSKDDQTASEIKTLYESNTQTNPLTDAEKAVIDGVTANTSELNKLDGVTASTAQLNIVSGKTFRASGDGTLTTTSDTELPSSKVIASHVASAITNVGGFVTIANEVSFPTTAAQPANGVIVSISDAAGTVVNGSGVSTTGRTTDGTPATVTINNFPSSLNSETLASGVALLVTSTGSSNTYNYHKILAAETDVKSLSDDINDFNARYRVASSAPSSALDDGDLWFDTSANKMKVYNATGSSWDDVASVGQFFINTVSSSSGTGGGSATFNGSAYRFTLSNPATGGAAQLLVSINGVIQKPNAGSSQPSEGFAISGNDIIFSAAPASGSDYYIVTQGSSVSIGTPSANSVNSSHIIDGSIVNADVSNSAAIAGSKVADDSIPEAKLDVHNTPATGKYLKYTSNGMEWSDGASEGTDVKSTGESGTNKYLRIDGDGTSSWQIPSEFVTLAQGGTVNGQINLTSSGAFPLTINTNNDAKLALQGTNNPYIQFRESSTNKAEVAWSADGYLKLNNSEDGSQLRLQDDLKFSVDGSTFYSVLTSNSTLNSSKLSGALPAISGASLTNLPPGGNSVDLVADGAIGAGKPVIITTAGKAKAASAIYTQRSSTGNGPGYVTVEASVSCNFGSMAYDASIDRLCQVYHKASAPNKLVVKAGQVLGNGSTTWGTAITPMSDLATNGTAICSIGGGKFFIALNVGANYKAFIVSVSNVTCSASSEVTFDTCSGGGGTIGHRGLAYDPDTGRVVCHYRVANDGTNSHRGYACVFSISGTTITAGTPVETYAGNTTTGHSVCYDEHSNRMVLVWNQMSNYDGRLKLATVSSSANSLTLHSMQGDFHNECKDTTVCTNNKGQLAIGFKNDADSQTSAVLFTINASNNTVSFGTREHFDTTGEAGTEHQTASICYDALSDLFVMAWAYDDSNQYIHCTSRQYSGTTWGTKASETYLTGAKAKHVSALAVANGGQSFIIVAYNTTNTTGQRTAGFEVSTASTNITWSNIIGFTDAAINDTATGTIKCNGNNVSNQSGLTPGTRYYVQNNGTLGTSPVSTNFGGVALASDKILITHQRSGVN